jgi:hypothetical protein
MECAVYVQWKISRKKIETTVRKVVPGAFCSKSNQFLPFLQHSQLFLSLFTQVEYQTYPSMKWFPAMYEQSVVEQLLNSQFHTFVNKVKTTDCQAELRRLLASGPPIYISDKHAMPVPDEDTYIISLWYASDSNERSAKLDGALEGEERQKLWDELKEFVVVEGKEAEDEDATEEQQRS